MNNELIFEVLVFNSSALEKVIEWQNQTRGSDFEIVKETKKIKDGLDLVAVKGSSHKVSEIFYLGYGVSVMKNDLEK